MKKVPARLLERGFVHTLPLLVISLLIIIGSVALDRTDSESQQIEKSVLSETSNSDANIQNRGQSEKSQSDKSARGPEVKVQTRVPSGLRVESKNNNGTIRVDVFERGKGVNVGRRANDAVVEVENNDAEVEKTFELGEGEEVKVETEDDTDLSVTKRGSKFVILDGSIEATTKFPLSIDLATNELIVTTPAGVKRVTVLPQTAIDNMIRVGHVHVILPPEPEPTASGSGTPIATSSATPEGTPEGSPESTPSGTPEGTIEPTPLESSIGVEIVEEEGTLKYRIRGARRERFLGLIEILIPRTLEVSAETGELLSTEQSAIDQLISLLSF